MKHFNKRFFTLCIAFTLCNALISQNYWSWMNGSSTLVNLAPAYGTQGTPSATNSPGGREGASTWTDNTGNLWLFGGGTPNGGMSDLWRYNPVTGEWTWVKGPTTSSQPPTYGTVGVASNVNNPGSSHSGCSWVDNSGDLWLLCGIGYTANADLWKYKISTNQWTCMRTSPQFGVYGTQGVAAANNSPGHRFFATAWTDPNGDFWLFGGEGYNATGYGLLNDLWKYNPASNMWTWVRGTSGINQPAVYGTQGVPAALNRPGNRALCTSWTDNAGNLWLFGGWNSDFETYGDLWKFTPATNQWTWEKGANTPDPVTVFSAIGVAAATNEPGSAVAAGEWKDQAGNLWLFGGYGASPSGSHNYSALWKFNISTNQWSWEKGPTTSFQPAVYGTQGLPAVNNNPPALSNAAAWADNAGNFWIFGGDDNATYSDVVWKYGPCAIPANPANSTPAADQTLCSGTALNLSVQAGTNTVNWYASATATTILASGNSYTAVATNTTSGPMVVTYYAEALACGPSASRTAISVTVNPSPVVSVSGGAICAGQSFTITPSGATSYTFSSGGNVVSPSTATGYTVTGSNTAGCTGSVVASVAINPLPILGIAASSTVFCAGNTATISVSGASTYLWNNGSNGSVMIVNPAVTTVYNVTGTSASGCSNSAAITLSVMICSDPPPVGINENTGTVKHLDVFPNPGSGLFTIEIDGVIENAGIELYNATGQMVLKTAMANNTATCDITAFADGIYFLRIMKDKMIVSQSKVVKR